MNNKVACLNKLNVLSQYTFLIPIENDKHNVLYENVLVW